MVGEVKSMCKKIIEFINEKDIKLGGMGSLPNTYQGILNVWVKKGGRIIFGISKTDEIDTSNAENFDSIVEIGGGAVPHLKVHGIVNAEKFNGGITDTVTIGDKVLIIKGGIITKVEDKK